MLKIKDKETVKIIVVLTLLSLLSALILSLVYKYVKVDDAAIFRNKVAESYSSPLTGETLDISGFSPPEYSEIKSATLAEDGAAVILVKSKKVYSSEGLELIVIIKAGIIEKIIVNKAQETPGVGSKVVAESYFSNYYGLNVADFDLSKPAPEGISVDAVTGATRTSNGVKYAVKAAAALYEYLEGEGRI